jgi:hypothetical protein
MVKMFSKTKKIIFKSDKTSVDLLKPAPTSRIVPEWFRTMKGVYEGIESVKKCVPVLDALTAGYTIPLPADVTFSKASKRFLSTATFEVVTSHHATQTADVELPPEYDPQPWKWTNSWYIKTPPGYSTLFIHPLNRMDLPFHSFTGIVDTDKHPLVINFPFVLRNDFEGTIKAGTPVIQAIPFKRDDWESDVIDTGESYNYENMHEVDMPPFNWYKRKFWSKKRYS